MNLIKIFLITFFIGFYINSFSQNIDLRNFKTFNSINKYVKGNLRNRFYNFLPVINDLSFKKTGTEISGYIDNSFRSVNNNSELNNGAGSFKKSEENLTEPVNVNFKAGYLREIEELYSTNSFYQNLKISKRFSDLINLRINVGVDYSKRQEIGLPDLKRWYDNSGINCELNFNPYNTLNMFVSGSISDTTFTSYGFSYNSIAEAGAFQFNNNLTLSYDYFYFWNQVAQNFASDNIEINYNKFSFSAGYFFGVVDFNYVDGYEYKAKNPNSSFNCQLQYEILKKPLINAGINFNTRDFKYYSPLYYSPQDRKITGINTSIYNTFNEFYFYFGSGARIDNNDVFIWDIDGEFGYDTGNFSLSGGLSRYNDPYYTSYNTFINISKSF